MRRTLTGSDGMAIIITDGWRGLHGSDDRMIAIRVGGWSGLQGSDGRMVEIPAGALGLQGSDGRMVGIALGKHGVQDVRGRMRAKNGYHVTTHSSRTRFVGRLNSGVRKQEES